MHTDQIEMIKCLKVHIHTHINIVSLDQPTAKVEINEVKKMKTRRHPASILSQVLKAGGGGGTLNRTAS